MTRTKHSLAWSVALISVAVLGLAGSGPFVSAHAESFPSSAIRIVVPTPPGTPPDIISRVVASQLSEREGWRMVVENRPGAL